MYTLMKRKNEPEILDFFKAANDDIADVSFAKTGFCFA